MNYQHPFARIAGKSVSIFFKKAKIIRCLIKNILNDNFY